MNEDVSIILLEAEERMTNAVKAMREDFKSIRTGRASPALVEQVPVPYYGIDTPLQQLATISAPEPRLLTVKPFNAKDITAIERAILSANLGLNPASDGKLIRLAIPQLTEERRRELTKTVSKRTEDGRVAVRNIRRDANNDLRKLEKDKEISEDELRSAEDDVQKLTDHFIKEVDQVGKAKEDEVMEV